MILAAFTFISDEYSSIMRQYSCFLFYTALMMVESMLIMTLQFSILIYSVAKRCKIWNQIFAKAFCKIGSDENEMLFLEKRELLAKFIDTYDKLADLTCLACSYYGVPVRNENFLRK